MLSFFTYPLEWLAKPFIDLFIYFLYVHDLYVCLFICLFIIGLTFLHGEGETLRIFCGQGLNVLSFSSSPPQPGLFC